MSINWTPVSNFGQIGPQSAIFYDEKLKVFSDLGRVQIPSGTPVFKTKIEGFVRSQALIFTLPSLFSQHGADFVDLV
jgi:hypothetical protein